MKIGLWSDSHNFPSLPLMKLSAYRKSIGDEVEMLNYLNHYDLVYASKVFSFTPDIEHDCIVQADKLADIMAEVPTADVQEVVRCKDCTHLCKDLSGRECHLCMRCPLQREVTLDSFCSYGERMDGDEK